MSGFWAGDSIAQAMDNAELKKLLYSKQNHIDVLMEDNAGNLAEKVALRKALAQYNPNHPLLVNKDLQGRIHKAAATAMSMTNDWDSCREVGNTFKY